MTLPGSDATLAIMYLDLENLSEAQMKSELEKTIRQFEVAYSALHRLTAPGRDAEAMREDAADTLKIIESYPNHPRFSANHRADG